LEQKPASTRSGKTRIFIISLVTAGVFWFFNALHAPSRREVSLPLHYGPLPVSVRLIGDLPSRVSVSVEGRGFGFLSADLSEAFDETEIDLAGLVARQSVSDTLLVKVALQRLLALRPDATEEPLRIVGTHPDTLVVRLTGNYSKRVPVIVNLSLQFRNQYMQDGRLRVQPDSIEISGARDILDRITFVGTPSLVLNDLHGDSRFTAPLELDEDRIVSTVKEVTVTIPVSEFAEGRVAVPITHPAENGRPLVILPSRVMVTYRAPVRRFATITASDFAVALQSVSAQRAVNRSLVQPVKAPEMSTVTSIAPAWVEYYFLN